VPSIEIEHESAGSVRRSDLAILISIAAAVALAHLLTNNRYGFHRDELQFLSDALHLDWGFVAYPPLTPFVERVGMSFFGLSMVGLRLFSVLAQAVAIVVTGLAAKELGGARLAQVTAALAVAFSPLALFSGTEFQYTSFDFFWWVLIAYFIIRLLRSENPRWWLAIGAAIGIGLLTKYAIIFYIAGILVGLALTPARRYFKNSWFWIAVALALIIFLPNFLWLVHHNFISYHFLQHIHARDVRLGRANGFISGQFLLCANLAAAPVWIAGLIGFLRNPRYRMLAFMYLVPLAVFYFSKGRNYYMAGAYPMLLAMGAVRAEQWLRSRPRWARLTVASAYFAVFAFISLYICTVVLPIASSGPLKNFALSRNGDLREEFGWTDLVRTVAQIRNSLPPAQQAGVGVFVANYGEAGAIELLGPAWHLPPPISTTNSAWLRGYPNPAPTAIIVLGLSEHSANAIFTSCRWAGHNTNSEDIKNEERQDHPNIFVCGPPREPWPVFWSQNLWFG
jgi:4-amino-4-deoxy-L-arabinose transferase-like glycosyltransferase